MLIKVLNKYGYGEENLFLVDNIGKWAKENNAIDILNNKSRLYGSIEIALTAIRTDSYGKRLRIFIITNIFPPSQVNQILQNKVFKNRYLSNFIVTEEQFIMHRILHEIAHANMGFSEEEEENCDEWALSEMGMSN